MCTALRGYCGQAYTWDDNGDLLSDGNAMYAYDQANRLISVTVGVTTTQFAYNGDGARLQQVVNEAVTTYTLDLAAPLVQVLVAKDSGGDTRYLYGVTRIGEQQAAGWVYHLSDALGSVRQLVDSEAQVVLARGYTPYGEPLRSEGTGHSAYGYTGEAVDVSTGLVFLRARYMQPTLGMFLSRDPWGGNEEQPESMDGSNYGLGNPINQRDPLGTCVLQLDTLLPGNPDLVCIVERRDGANGGLYAIGRTYDVPQNHLYDLLQHNIDMRGGNWPPPYILHVRDKVYIPKQYIVLPLTPIPSPTPMPQTNSEWLGDGFVSGWSSVAECVYINNEVICPGVKNCPPGVIGAGDGYETVTNLMTHQVAQFQLAHQQRYWQTTMGRKTFMSLQNKNGTTPRRTCTIPQNGKAMKKPSITAYIICVSMMCAGLIGCTSISIRQPAQVAATGTGRVKSISATPFVQRGTPTSTRASCEDDVETPVLQTGWRLQWQRVFEHPIARPPEINNAQMVLLEREDPVLDKVKDAVWVMDPRTSHVLWQFRDVNGIASYSMRQVTDIQWSQKYLALNVLYDKLPSMPHTAAYVVVLDRVTGQIVYSEALNTVEMTIGDDALYYRGTYRELRRMDLPDRTPRWEKPLVGGTGLDGLFLVGPRLYEFNADQTIYQHDLLDGSLVATARLDATPIIGDVLIQDHLALLRSWYGYEGVVAFDVKTFAPTWSTDVSYPLKKQSNTFPYGISTMAVSSDSVYLFDAQDNLLRVNLSTGKTLWFAPSTGVQAMSRPAVSHGLVYGLFADGTVRAFSDVDGSSAGIVMQVPLWYWKSTDAKEWRDLVGGLGVADDMLIVTTGCRSVYAIQREP